MFSANCFENALLATKKIFIEAGMMSSETLETNKKSKWSSHATRALLIKHCINWEKWWKYVIQANFELALIIRAWIRALTNVSQSPNLNIFNVNASELECIRRIKWFNLFEWFVRPLGNYFGLRRPSLRTIFSKQRTLVIVSRIKLYISATNLNFAE